MIVWFCSRCVCVKHCTVQEGTDFSEVKKATGFSEVKKAQVLVKLRRQQVFGEVKFVVCFLHNMYV